LIHGYSELLVQRALNLPATAVTEMAGEIHAGSSVMRRLVDDLLDFSQWDQGRLQLEQKSMDVAELLSPMISGFRHQPGRQRLQAELPTGLAVRVDPDRCAQIVNNLLDNALR